MTTHAPIHPGEVLREDFLIPLGLSDHRVAKDIGVPPGCINEIVKGTRALTVSRPAPRTLLRVAGRRVAEPSSPTTTSKPLRSR
jgi:hypothetical protein